MKCIKHYCPYYVIRKENEIFSHCNIFNEGYEIIDEECLIEDHIRCGEYDLNKAKEQLRLIRNIDKKLR